LAVPVANHQPPLSYKRVAMLRPSPTLWYRSHPPSH